MAISLTNFLVKFNNLVGGTISGTTDSAGAVDKTTFIDSALSKYDDDYFGDPERSSQWWAYIGSTLRSIKAFQSSTGTVTVHTAFGSQIATSTAYTLYRFDRDKEIVACNEALNEAYPWFYKRVEDSTTLDGKGINDTEYTVPAAFTEPPCQIFEKDTDALDIEYTEVVDYDLIELGGAWKFYANITLANDILLVGKKPLTQFTTDASTTELTDAQAEVVALLAVSIFYRNLSGIVNATDSGRYDSLANRYEQMWEERKYRYAMPALLPGRIRYGWLPE